MFSTHSFMLFYISAHTSAYNSYTSYGLFRKRICRQDNGWCFNDLAINNVNCVVGFNIKQIPVFVYKHTFAVYNFALVARNYRGCFASIPCRSSRSESRGRYFPYCNRGVIHSVCYFGLSVSCRWASIIFNFTKRIFIYV
jgi:hypothetical protein